MILALIRPCSFPSVRGNAFTIQRFQSDLREESLGIEVFSLDRQDHDAIMAGIRHYPMLHQSLPVRKGA